MVLPVVFIKNFIYFFRSDFENTFQEFSLNLHPSQDLMNQAYKDMMKYLNWTRAAILYEDDFGLVRLQDLVRTPYTKNLELYIRQTTPDNYRMVLKEIKKKGIHNIIVDTSSSNMNYFFRYYFLKYISNYRFLYMYLCNDFFLELFCNSK